MNITAVKNALELNIFIMGNDKAEVLSCYAGDLPDMVMSHAKQGTLWLTVLPDVNVAAVAKLTGMAAVVLCQNVQPDEALLAKARQQGVTLLGTKLNLFEASAELSKLL